MPKRLTYEQFGQALVHLGFNEVPGPGYTIYRNDAHDATLVIPTVSPTEPVRPIHLVAAREMILGKGVTDSKTFMRMMMPIQSRSGSGDKADAFMIVPGKSHRPKVGRNTDVAVSISSNDRRKTLHSMIRRAKNGKEQP